MTITFKCVRKRCAMSLAQSAGHERRKNFQVKYGLTNLHNKVQYHPLKQKP